jgi:hypothetical protein
MSDLTVASPNSAATEQVPEPAAPEPAADALSETASAEAGDTQPSQTPDTPAEASSPWGATGQTGPTWGAGTQTVPATSSGTAQKYTHSGYRYVLGYGADFFGIWNRDNPSMPTERYPRTDQGWRDAWSKFIQLEPNHMAVPEGAAAGSTAPAASMSGGVAPQIQMNPTDTAVLQYTHSGTRYLLGYGQTFFGIWDRQNPTMPMERFPRSDDGWAQAWRRYTQIENNFNEVR